MMKKDLRKTMDILDKIIFEAEDYSDGISDLKQEGGDNPSMELAKEIADDYSLDPIELMKRFRIEQNRQENTKMGS